MSELDTLRAENVKLRNLAEAVKTERSLCKLFREAYLSWEPTAKLLSRKRMCDDAVKATDDCLSALSTQSVQGARP